MQYSNLNFRAVQREPITNIWLDKAALRKIGIWSVVFLGIIWLMAPMLYRPLVQPFGNEWILHGKGLASIAIWGYSLLIKVLGNVGRVVLLQSILGAIATASLMIRLNILLPKAKKIVTFLFVMALPWLSYMAFAYQMPMSSVFMIFTLLAMEMAISSGKIYWGVVAAILAAIGQNFRSELLLLPFVILIAVLILRMLKFFHCVTVRPLIVCVCIAFVLQLPWAFNCYYNAGRFSFSESNLGHTAFVELAFPSNPWKIQPTDAFCQETVDKAGLHFSSLSFEGSDFLMGKFIDNVKQYPLDYVKCIAFRCLETIVHPFASIPLNTITPGMKAIHTKVIRDPNELSSFDEAKLEQEKISGLKYAFMWFYYISNGILNRAISILGIIGFFLAMRVGPFRLTHPLILLFSIVVIYRCGLNVLIGASGKYMVSVYLCYIPFVINTILYFKDKLLVKWKSA